MKLDAEQVKDRISLADLFARDAHELRKMGSSQVCYCPFHEEKTRSCHVHDDEGYYKCFGCGAGGDCFNYWQQTRGCDFAQALKDLAAIAGIVADVPMPAVKRMAPPKMEEEMPAPRLEGAALNSWLEGVDRLRLDLAAQTSIAQWRGYSLTTIGWAVERGLLGLVPMYGEWREAFLVERPEGEGRIPVGYHVRLGPQSAGNPNPKASWRYLPKGIGAWPFVIGDVSRARVVFALEGQWDGLALFDAMAWAEAMPASCAIVGMRGATSWKRFLRSYSWPDDATFFALSDADKAGRGWFGEGGFIQELRPRCRRVWGFWPASAQGKDFNDVWRDRVMTGDELKQMLRAKMRRPVMKVHGPTFLQFCRAQKWREDEVGAIARIVCSEERRPHGRKRWTVWDRFFTRYVPVDRRPYGILAWKEWQSSNQKQLQAQEQAWANMTGGVKA